MTARVNVEETLLIEPVIAQTFTDCMEQLQEGYVASVAATAGCAMNRVSRDNYGFDVLMVRVGGEGEEEVSVYLQLKNTTTVHVDPSKQTFSYQFKKRRYLEVLARERKGIKAFLVVMVTRPEQALWSSASHSELRVSHACYWANLEGHPIPEGVESPSVKLSTSQIFDANALTSILNSVR